jgi:transcriptional regulator with XRE-family HTH domain
MGVGKSIKFLRIAMDLKQQELAKELKISTNYLSLIENDKREPSLSFLKNLSNKLDVPISLFFLDLEFEGKKYTPDEQVMLMKIKDLIMQIESMRLQNSK